MKKKSVLLAMIVLTMGIVDKYENNIIVIREMDDEDIILYFSTQDAQVIEGDSPIAAGDVVEITYIGVQGDKENPGIAVKVVAANAVHWFNSLIWIIQKEATIDMD